MTYLVRHGASVFAIALAISVRADEKSPPPPPVAALAPGAAAPLLPEISCFVERAKKIDLVTLNTPSLSNTYRMGLVAWLAYFDHPESEEALHRLGYYNVEYIERIRDDEKKPKGQKPARILADTQAIWAEAADHVVLAFRGTEGTKKLDIRTDLLGIKHRMGRLGKVHTGFYGALTIVWRDVIRRINAMETSKPIYITGHSLGGALAILTSTKLMANRLNWEPAPKKSAKSKADIAEPDAKGETVSSVEDIVKIDLPDPRVPLKLLNELFERPIDDQALLHAATRNYWVRQVVTFGAPAVGNREFVRNLEEIYLQAARYRDEDHPADYGFSSARFVNRRDIVPVLSPRILLGYRATPDLVLIDNDGTIKVGPKAHKLAPKLLLSLLGQFKHWSRAHHMATYLMAIGKGMGVDTQACYDLAIKKRRSVDRESLERFMTPVDAALDPTVDTDGNDGVGDDVGNGAGAGDNPVDGKQ